MDAGLPSSDEPVAPVRTLSAPQRRVLGALLEKAFTTPDAYPLTPKSLTAACSQKSNRDPVRDYSEDEVLDVLQELQELGLVAEIHTDGGRTARYRHLARKRYPFTEPQLAILTELWLRGRQQIGELRSRAGRMAAIDSLEDLRAALQPLISDGYVRASGPLERRGVEVDHGFYPEDETPDRWGADSGAASETMRSAGSRTSSTEVQQLREQVGELAGRVADLESRLVRVEELLESLRG